MHKQKLYLFSKFRVTKLLLIVFAFTFIVLHSNAQEKNITILYTNDIESVYEPVEAFWNNDIDYIGGLPYLATLIHQIQKKEEISFLFDAGDIFTGALSEATNGKLPFDVYSSIGYDAIALGNHEFEYGWENLLRVKQRARFPVLNCNIFYENTDINLCQAYSIVEKEGVRIGLIGVMGVEAFKNTMNPAHRIGIEARDPYPVVQNIINEIREEVDLVVLLTHQNLSAPMQTDKEADPEVQRGFDEDYEMAGRIKGVDVIIGGHSDNGLWKPVIHPKTGTIICLTFGQGKYLGYLNLDIIKKEIIFNEGKLIPVDASLLKSDLEVNKLMQKAREQNPELTETIGSVNNAGYRKYYRESTLGNLLADMLKEFSNADIGIINSGSIRADLNKGDITLEELINIYPFVDKFHVVEINGKSLKKLLEYSYQLTYGFVQLSGVTITYNSQNLEGHRLINATINGKPINESKKYTVASSSFLANGGDGFEMLEKGRLISISEANLIDYYIDYIRSKKHLEIPPLGRQIDVSRK